MKIEVDFSKFSNSLRVRLAGELEDSEGLAVLAKDEDAVVRVEVAVNRNTSKSDLSRLAEDKEWIVRSAVADNPNTLESDLLKLAEDKDERVRHHATERLKAIKTK